MTVHSKSFSSQKYYVSENGSKMCNYTPIDSEIITEGKEGYRFNYRATLQHYTYGIDIFGCSATRFYWELPCDRN